MIEQLISKTLGLPERKVASTINLLQSGATIPFISRYRKEATGSLDEVAIANIQQELNKVQELIKRKETILKTIEEQGKLTDSLKSRINECWEPSTLEDIYLPYKPKRKTKASIAREKGLEPLAQSLFSQKNFNPEKEAEKFLNEEVGSVDEALQGARDIIAEWIAEDEKARQKVRHAFKKGAFIHARVARGKEEEAAKYKDYFDFSEPLNRCPSHRLLAMRRGEDEGLLRVSISPDEEDILYRLEKFYLISNTPAAAEVKTALHDSYKRLLAPSIETEFRQLSKEKADEEAIQVFAGNLRQLLMAAPLGQHRVLAVDPGFRTGCKVVVLNESGDLLEHTTIFPHPPQSDENMAVKTLKSLIAKYQVEALAIGNGTAGRETLDLCRRADLGPHLQIFSVNEAGASIYSASPIAREEFPHHDVTVRGAISIGRSLMDPLAELVKIDPKSIGVGQYQHDVNQTKLKESLDRTVESCVNAIGVNLNTASKHLLTYVSGLGPALAQNIVEYRQQNGPFKSRKELLKVPRMGEKSFEQCAGFLRIREGHNPLDNTGVHPESYHIVEQMAKDLGVEIEELINSRSLRKALDLKRYMNKKVGLPTLTDIVKELDKPGLDPRGNARPFEFGNVHSIEDLRIGMILPGIVTNITNFGAFVDIGVKQDGLVHISQLANQYIKNPADVVQLNQEVQVKVLDIDLSRSRIQLSMKELGK